MTYNIKSKWRRTEKGNNIYFQKNLDKPFREQSHISVSKITYPNNETKYVVFASNSQKGYNIGSYNSEKKAMQIAEKLKKDKRF